MNSVGLIGGGSWPTAIMKMLCNNLDKVNWWMRNEESIKHIHKYDRNPKYLTSIRFDNSKLEISSNLEKVIQNSDVLIVAHPSAFLHELMKGLPKDIFRNKIVFSAVKGIIPEYNAIPARYLHKTFNLPYSSIGMIAGPCHAEEVAMERLSYLTVACQDIEKAEQMSKFLDCRYIKTTHSDDLFGTELCAVLKNVYAVTAGIYHGLGFGDNFQALLISNAIRESELFIDAVNPTHRDVKSSAYLGDLLVTAYSHFSRNRNFGSMIGKGYSVRAAQIEMNMVAEGYYAVKGIIEINKKFQVNIPIVDSTYRVLYEKVSPILEMQILTDKLT